MSNFHFRMPRAVDLRRHKDVAEWAEAEQVAARYRRAPGWRERFFYGLIGAGAVVVVLAGLIRLL